MKNIDFINSTISKKLDISEDIVKKVNKYYWKIGVRKKLSALEDNAVFIKGLATIIVSKYNINKQIFKIIKQIRVNKISIKYTEDKRDKIIADLYRRLRMLLIRRNEIAKQYYINEQNYRISKAYTNRNKEL